MISDHGADSLRWIGNSAVASSQNPASAAAAAAGRPDSPGKNDSRWFRCETERTPPARRAEEAKLEVTQ